MNDSNDSFIKNDRASPPAGASMKPTEIIIEKNLRTNFFPLEQHVGYWLIVHCWKVNAHFDFVKFVLSRRFPNYFNVFDFITQHLIFIYKYHNSTEHILLQMNMYLNVV